MREFACGFLLAYLLGAVPVGIIAAELDNPAATVIYTAVTWPNHVMRVAIAVKAARVP
jgi:hypothetical protein